MLDTKDINFDLIVEENPEIGKCLSLMWGKPEFIPYINNLLSVAKTGKAREFSVEMLLALMELSNKHITLHIKLYK